MKKIISTQDAPKAIGPYSQAVQVGNLLFLSGQIPLVPETMSIVEGDVSAQIHQVLKNLRAVMQAAGGTLDHIVKLTIFLTDLSVFPKVNEICAEYFKEPYPARATVQVSKLPKDVMVEIEAIASLT